MSTLSCYSISSELLCWVLSGMWDVLLVVAPSIRQCVEKAGLYLCRDAPAGRFSLQLWRQHVLANLPMYSILVPLYLDLARSRVSSRCEETLIDMKSG